MPTSIIWFEILSYLGVLLQVIEGAIAYPDASKQLGDASIYALTATGILISVFLIWSAARRRKNWARWLLLIILGLEMLVSVPTLADEFKSNMVVGAISVVILMLDGAAVYLLFCPGAQSWFAKKPKTEKEHVEEAGTMDRTYSNSQSAPSARPWLADPAKPKERAVQDAGAVDGGYSNGQIFFGVLTLIAVSALPILASLTFEKPISSEMFRVFVVLGGIGGWMVMSIGKRRA